MLMTCFQPVRCWRHIFAQPAAKSLAAFQPLVDVKVSVSRWPFRRLPCDETPRLVEKLHNKGVGTAWAGTLDGLFHKDIRTVNERLSATCRAAGGVLIPFGSINPTLPDWQEDLHHCAGKHHMPGVRLHPNYHGYRLDEPLFTEVMSLASRHRLAVRIVIHMEDERTMPPLGRVKPVDASPLLDLLPRWENTLVVLLNAFGAVRREELVRFLSMSNVYTDCAMLEGVGALETLLAEVPHTQVLFGSHSPLFYFESAVL